MILKHAQFLKAKEYLKLNFYIKKCFQEDF